jgi:hypothetical protein
MEAVEVRIARTKPRVMRVRKSQTSRESVTKLYNMAVMRARAAGDPRLDALLKAKPHERERVLRSMSIVTETDVKREFGG